MKIRLFMLAVWSMVMLQNGVLPNSRTVALKETDIQRLLTTYQMENLPFPVLCEELKKEFPMLTIIPEPTAKPEPTVTPEPTAEPTEEPTPEPTPEATPEPTEEVTPEPTAEATPEPTAEPTPEPTPEVTPEPTEEQAPEPTEEVTPEPTEEQAPEPTAEVTPEPTEEATPEPTAEATPEPTAEATPEPTAEVTPEPTAEVTPEPTPEATPEPTAEITPEPTEEITPEPTEEVTPEPTPEVTPEPTPEPTPVPTPELNTDPSTLTFLVNKEYKLSETYVPKLVEPKVNHCQPEGSQKRYMRPEAAKALEELFAAAKEDGYELWVKTAYRSWKNQYETYTWMLEYRGVEEAVYYHAVPGASEHQTGLAVDIVCEACEYDNTLDFEKTEEYVWLKENCYQYGFTLRYYEDKEEITGYFYEPWHFRYVGVELATYLMENSLTLEEYYNALPVTDLFEVPEEYRYLLDKKEAEQKTEE